MSVFQYFGDALSCPHRAVGLDRPVAHRFVHLRQRPARERGRIGLGIVHRVVGLVVEEAPAHVHALLEMFGTFGQMPGQG